MPNTLTKIKTEIRGFALYVGISEAEALAAGVSLSEIAIALKETLDSLVPNSGKETYATVALAPENAPGRNLELTRIALREPKITAYKEVKRQEAPARGIVIDLNRKQLFVDGRDAELTCREYELIALLVENSGKTVTREQIAALAKNCGLATPSARSIDVHVRRLRAKIANYESIIQTKRGLGYQFDKHPDVLIEQL